MKNLVNSVKGIGNYCGKFNTLPAHSGQFEIAQDGMIEVLRTCNCANRFSEHYLAAEVFGDAWDNKAINVKNSHTTIPTSKRGCGLSLSLTIMGLNARAILAQQMSSICV